MLKFLQYFLIEQEGNSHVIAFMRTNPLSRMHQGLVDSVVNKAQENNADHTVFLTRTNDKKNPLTPDQKIKHARIAFPKANVQLTSPDAPTMLHQASKLHEQGVNHLHVMGGSDRKDDFQRLLNTYNGKEGSHGYYNFHSINVHEFGGERNNAADGDESVSGTKMRKAVADNDMTSFHKMAPTTMNKTQKTDMFNDVRQGMFPPIDPKVMAKAKAKK